jgi:hypothetical protein
VLEGVEPSARQILIVPGESEAPIIKTRRYEVSHPLWNGELYRPSDRLLADGCRRTGVYLRRVEFRSSVSGNGTSRVMG